MKRAEDWIRFLRKYGPVAVNGNMYDENIMRTAKRTGIKPIFFEHPLTEQLLQCFDMSSDGIKSVVLTGAAGDGKTHLCRLVWEMLEGNQDEWVSDEQYLTTTVIHPRKGQIKIHVIRDLSAWVPQQGMEWPAEKEALLLKCCALLFENDPNDGHVVSMVV